MYALNVAKGVLSSVSPVTSRSVVALAILIAGYKNDIALNKLKSLRGRTEMCQLKKREV
jgi:hypothetical protein